VNIDLDYFFWHDGENPPGVMLSEPFFQKCLSILRRKIEDKTVAVTTIALTPSREFTGGWASTEELAQRVLARLGIDFFRLP
jgi:hypothetical protein